MIVHKNLITWYKKIEKKQSDYLGLTTVSYLPTILKVINNVRVYMYMKGKYQYFIFSIVYNC